MRARIRTLKPEIWHDEKVGDLSVCARLLFVGLITMADDEGRLRELPTAITGQIFPYDSVSLVKLGRWLDEIAATGMVVRYTANSKHYLAFRHWTAHQKVDRASASKLPPPPAAGSSNGSTSNRRVIDEESANDSTTNRAPRVRARPDPIPSVPKGSSNSSSSVAPFSSGRSAADEKTTDEDRQNCRLLAEQVKARNPKARVRSKNRWLREMRLLRERDGNPAEEIARLIRWLFSDTGKDAAFWADVIQSPANLREHYAQIWPKMNGTGRAVSVEDSAAFLARRSA